MADSQELQTEIDRRIAVEADLHAQLNASDDLFHLLIATVEDYAIFLLDPTGRVATWNPGAERFKGYVAEEIIGRHFSTFYPPEDIRSGKCEMELEVAERAGRFEDEGWRIRKDGTRFWANVVITALRDATGKLVGFGKVTRDLTERKHGEEGQRNADARYARLVESIKDYAIFMLDAHGRVASWNPGAERIKGYTPDEIIGAHFSRFYPEADVRAGKCEMALEVAARVGRFEDEGWRIRKDGARFWANVVISAVRDDLGELVGFSKVTRDLSEQKRIEEERAARVAAEESSRTKDEFLAILGHELRNPLAPILTAIQLLKLRGDPRSVREHQVIERQVKQMTRLVDDLLDVSRISHGKVELQRHPIDLREVLASAVEIAIPSLEKRTQDLEVDVPPGALTIHGDDARLIQIFANLLDNACKYTPVGGHIALIVRRIDNEVVVQIRDDGKGIDPGLLARMFEPFVQGSQNVDRAEGGLGLGLALVRGLVTMHDGTVEAESAGRDRGSCFTVRLPALDPNADQAVSADPQVAVSAAPAASRRRVLLVDDNEDGRTVLQDVLVTLGHEVQVAADGPKALALLETYRPHVAILDIGLPEMDGYELAARIRGLSGGAAIRLIAVTGYGQETDRARAVAAGFDLHIVKPVKINRLLAEIGASALT